MSGGSWLRPYVTLLTASRVRCVQVAHGVGQGATDSLPAMDRERGGDARRWSRAKLALHRRQAHRSDGLQPEVWAEFGRGTRKFVPAVRSWGSLRLGERLTCGTPSLAGTCAHRWPHPSVIAQLASISYQGLEAYLMYEGHVNMHLVGDFVEALARDHCLHGDAIFVRPPYCGHSPRAEPSLILPQTLPPARSWIMQATLARLARAPSCVPLARPMAFSSSSCLPACRGEHRSLGRLGEACTSSADKSL